MCYIVSQAAIRDLPSDIPRRPHILQHCIDPRIQNVHHPTVLPPQETLNKKSLIKGFSPTAFPQEARVRRLLTERHRISTVNM
jgi:hypothetical protein